MGMRRVATGGCICRCVGRTGTLRADALSMLGLQGRTAALRRLGPHRCLRSWTSHSPCNTAPLPAYTPTAVGAPRRKPPRARTSVHRADTRLRLDASPHPWWLPALTLRQRRTSRPLHGLRFQLHRARGRAPGLGPALDEPGSSERCGNPLGWVRLRVSPARAGLTAVMLRRLGTLNLGMVLPNGRMNND